MVKRSYIFKDLLSYQFIGHVVAVISLHFNNQELVETFPSKKTSTDIAPAGST